MDRVFTKETKYGNFLDVSNYIASGIVCNILILMEDLNLLSQDNDGNYFLVDNFSNVPNKLVVHTGILTLQKNHVIFYSNNKYQFTEFGKKLVEHLGTIRMIYGGYGGVVGEQLSKALDEPYESSENIRIKDIIKASNLLGDKNINPVIYSILNQLQVRGMNICDLGCGDGTRLIKLCEQYELNGLGIELSQSVVDDLNRQLKESSNINIKQGDITKLDSVWPGIEILIQCMVMHDITPTKKCISILKSYLNNFPNLKYFLYIDVVGISADSQSQIPGFDYIHSLMGIKPRTYSETLEMFDKADYKIMKEEQIKGLPNTYVWLLSPKKYR